MRPAPACLLIASALPSATLADVVIDSRSSELNAGSFTPGPNLGNNYSDQVSENQLSPTGTGTLDLVTFHGLHFVSTANGQTISAGMFGGGSTGGMNSPGSSRQSTRFTVVFRVTEASELMTMNISSGSIHPYGVFGQEAGTSLTVVNFATGELVFDLYRDLPPQFLGGLNPATWSNSAWTGLLEPGVYVLLADSHLGATYSHGGGSGSSGGGTLNFTTTFTPATAPAMAPAPSAAACLALGALVAARRRRERARLRHVGPVPQNNLAGSATSVTVRRTP